MKTAYIFPGQGAQFSGMGKELYAESESARAMFDRANEILGFDIAKVMFEGDDEALKQTNVTQPAVFLHSVILASTIENFSPDMVAGHSLGEFSALVASKALDFEDGLRLVAQRATAMQQACEASPSTMAAVLNLDDEIVENICKTVSDETGEIVIAANYNCPGQLVISGSLNAVNVANERMKEAGAKRVLILPVGGAFHSPLMESARELLAQAIEQTVFNKPVCPIYQNINAQPFTDVSLIKQNLITHLITPVRWTQTIQNMLADGATAFVECGPGRALQGMVKKITFEAETRGI